VHHCVKFPIPPEMKVFAQSPHSALPFLPSFSPPRRKTSNCFVKLGCETRELSESGKKGNAEYVTSYLGGISLSLRRLFSKPEVTNSPGRCGGAFSLQEYFRGDVFSSLSTSFSFGLSFVDSVSCAPRESGRAGRRLAFSTLRRSSDDEAIGAVS